MRCAASTRSTTCTGSATADRSLDPVMSAAQVRDPWSTAQRGVQVGRADAAGSQCFDHGVDDIVAVVVSHKIDHRAQGVGDPNLAQLSDLVRVDHRLAGAESASHRGGHSGADRDARGDGGRRGTPPPHPRGRAIAHDHPRVAEIGDQRLSSITGRVGLVDEAEPAADADELAVKACRVQFSERQSFVESGRGSR